MARFWKESGIGKKKNFRHKHGGLHRKVMNYNMIKKKGFT